jgi:hypothetical protein
MAGLLASVAAVILHDQVTAPLIGGTTVIGLVTVFVTGKWKESKQDLSNESDPTSAPPEA